MAEHASVFEHLEKHLAGALLVLRFAGLALGDGLLAEQGTEHRDVPPTCCELLKENNEQTRFFATSAPRNPTAAGKKLLPCRCFEAMERKRMPNAQLTTRGLRRAAPLPATAIRLWVRV